jgi:hypothetical protein
MRALDRMPQRKLVFRYRYHRRILGCPFVVSMWRVSTPVSGVDSIYRVVAQYRRIWVGHAYSVSARAEVKSFDGLND